MRRLLIVVSLLSALSVPAWAQKTVLADRIRLGSTPCLISSGAASPESNVAAAVCSTYYKTDGTVWVKTSGGTGNTGWTLQSSFWSRTGTALNPTTTSDRVGVGVVAPGLRFDVYGDAPGLPASSGSTQTGIARFSGSYDNALDFGQTASSPFGVWVQGTNKTDLSIKYPLLLQPTGGNVGIGTTTPGGKLEVNRGTQAEPSTTGATTLANSALALSSATDTTTRLMAGVGDGAVYTWIQAQTTSTNEGRAIALNPISGNVGVATNTPTARLHTYGASGGSPSLTADVYSIFKVSTTITPELVFGGYPAAPYGMWVQTKRSTNDGTAYPLVLNPLGGLVGIGISDPAAALDVYGSIIARGSVNSYGAMNMYITSANTFSGGYNVYKRGTTGDATAAVTAWTELGYHAYYGWDSAGYGRGAYTIAHTTEAWTASAHGTRYGIVTTPNGSTTGVEALSVSQAGYVGIGVTTATYRLQVEEARDALTGVWARNTNSGTSAGNVVYVNSDAAQASFGVYSAAHSAWPDAVVLSASSTASNGLNIATGTTAPIKLWTNSTLRMTLLGAGGVEVVGNVSPSSADLYDLGTYSAPWRKGFITENMGTLFTLATQTIYGGWSTVNKGACTFEVAVAAADTAIDFGTTMTPNQFVIVRALDTAGAARSERLKVGTLVSGTNYNVTRYDTGRNWPKGTPFAVRGVDGDGWLEMQAYDTPRFSVWKQGALYTDTTEYVRLGYLDGFLGIASGKIGLAIGDTNQSLRYYDGVLSVTGTVDVGTVGKVIGGQSDYATGTGFFLGYSGGAHKLSIGTAAGNRLTWDGTNLTLGSGFFSVGTAGPAIVIGSAATGSKSYNFTSTMGGVLYLTAYEDSSTYRSTSIVNSLAGATVTAGLTLMAENTTNGYSAQLTGQANGSAAPVWSMWGNVTMLGNVSIRQGTSNGAGVGELTVEGTTGATANLNSSETAVVATSLIGRVNFSDPNEASGGDATQLAASIAAVAEGSFTSTYNATALVFYNGNSEAATEKMRLSSQGRVSLTGTDNGVLFNSRDGSGTQFSWYNPTGDGLSLYAASDIWSITSAGVMTVTGYGTHTFTGAGINSVKVVDTVDVSTSRASFHAVSGTGTVAYAGLLLDAGTNTGNAIYAMPQGYADTAPNYLNGMTVYAANAGGLSLAAVNASGAMRFYTGGTTERMNLSTGGYLTLSATGTTLTGLRVGAAAGDYGARFARYSTAVVLIGVPGTTASERVAITTSAGNNVADFYGNGTTTLAGTLTITGLASGNLTSASGVITSSSDERLKDVIGPLGYGLAEVLQLRPIRYHWNASSGIPTGPIYGGFGAQQVEKWMPLAVSYGADGMRGLSDRVILGAVVGGIQEINTELKLLRARIAELEAKGAKR